MTTPISGTVPIGNYVVYGLLAVGLAANRPTAGIVDRWYFSTDTLIMDYDTGIAWVESLRGEAAMRLAQLAERAHASLTGIGAADHHARYTDVEAGALIAIHAALVAAHHARYTDGEANARIAIHAAIPAAHHVPATVGGLYGINVQTLAAGKTLTPGTDEIYQYLDEGGANRIITLATVGATAGDRFVIRHNGAYNDTHYLQIKQGATELDRAYAGAIKEFVFNGTNWISGETGTGENDLKREQITIGYKANAYSSGVAIGYVANANNRGVAIGDESPTAYTRGVAVGRGAVGYSYGVGIGYGAAGNSYGVGVGYEADGSPYGVAVGYKADSDTERYSIALGYNSKCERAGETSVNIDGHLSQKNNAVQGRWSKTTSNNAPIEIHCAGYVTRRFTIRASSALAFRMTIVARDNVAGHVAMYTVDDGLIKRDGANNTVMVNCTVVTVHEDDAGWDVAVTADDGNEALIITVTGDAANPTQWAVVMDGVETHF